MYDEPMKRAVAYLRVSTAEQALSGLGLDAQRSAIEAECARQGWDLVAKTVEVALVDFPADLTTPAGRMVLTVLAGAAELERGLISERTRAAMAEAKRRGVHCGRPRAMPDEIRARILEAHAAGQSLNAIARSLNADEIPTAGGGARWYASTVRSVVVAA